MVYLSGETTTNASRRRQGLQHPKYAAAGLFPPSVNVPVINVQDIDGLQIPSNHSVHGPSSLFVQRPQAPSHVQPVVPAVPLPYIGTPDVQDLHGHLDHHMGPFTGSEWLQVPQNPNLQPRNREIDGISGTLGDSSPISHRSIPPPPAESDSSGSRTPKAYRMLQVSPPLQRSGATPTQEMYSQRRTPADKTPVVATAPLPRSTYAMALSAQMPIERRVQTEGPASQKTEWPALPSSSSHSQQKARPQLSNFAAQPRTGPTTSGETRVKPSWIVGSPTPPEPPTGFASQFPIGSYVLRAVTDERYGPASSSSSRQGGEAHRNGKLRPCFVTFHDGPRVYVAPVLSAPQNANDENFLPFLSRNNAYDWWLPVEWAVYEGSPCPPKPPVHPSDRKALRQYETAQRLAGPAQSVSQRPKQRPHINIEWKDSPYPLTSCFMWVGDPGDRIATVQDAVQPIMQVRHISHAEIGRAATWWNRVWYAMREPPRPKSEHNA